MERTSSSPIMGLAACHCCGLIQQVPAMAGGQTAVCARCATAMRVGRDHVARTRWTAILSAIAFFLYWPAVLLPIVEIERFGHRSQSSILAGVAELLRSGEWFVGIVVFVFSIVFPLAKICLLLDLSLLRLLHERHQAVTYRIVEFLGRWSMLDVLLLALLVMLIKMKTILSFHLGPAVYAFCGCVVASMVASMVFDPHALWDEKG